MSLQAVREREGRLCSDGSEICKYKHVARERQMLRVAAGEFKDLGSLLTVGSAWTLPLNAQNN